MNIAVSLNVVELPEKGETRDSLDHAWYEIFDALDIIPILVPNDLALVKRMMNSVQIDGLLLTGGNNISSSGVGDFSCREAVELYLLEHAVKKVIPVFGVCRGMQLINQFFNGQLTPIRDHVAQVHAIKSVLGVALPASVNSFHQYGILKEHLGRELKPLAMTSSENSTWIEALAHETLPVKAIMWHPERQPKNCQLTLELMKDHFKGKK